MLALLLPISTPRHSAVLEKEYIEGAKLPKFREDADRKKRRALDLCGQRIITAATTDEGGKKRIANDRPLIIGVGDSAFPSGGRGEISVPTNKVVRALERAVRREQDRGRRVEIRPVRGHHLFSH